MKIVFSRRSAMGLKLCAPLGVVIALLASISPAQSLAAAARKEKARRAKIVAPGKVLTEGDAPARAGNVTVTELAAPAPTSDTPSPQATPSTDEQRNIWKTRAEGLRAALVAAEKSLEQAQRAEAAFRSDVAPLSAADAQDPMRLQKREAKLAEMNQQIEVLKAGVAAARANIAALEDEARRAGVPSGWLR